MLAILTIGFLLGMKHAMEADHLAAVAAMVEDQRGFKHALTQGAAWGTGHTLTLFLFGTLVLIADLAIPERLATGLEMVVGVMLVVLGLDVARRLIKTRAHIHVHKHEDGTRHIHFHSHGADREVHDHTHAAGMPLRSLLVGLVHGMAGSAVLILLAVQAVDSPLLALTYIALFGVGSIVGMALLSVVIAVPLRSTQRFRGVHATLRWGVAVLTVAVGFELGLSSGLNLLAS